jgi:hypothetical protein
LVNDWNKLIRGTWFKNHRVRVSEVSEDTTIIDWDNGSYFCKMRIILDKNIVYISGDLGSAIYTLTCKKATIDEIASYDIGYFNEKLTTFSCDENEFVKEIAKNDVENWYINTIESGVDKDKVGNIHYLLIDILEGCICSMDEWKEELLIRQDEIETVENDLFESTLIEAGSVKNIYLYAYLELFKMIKIQLDNELKVS